MTDCLHWIGPVEKTLGTSSDVFHWQGKKLPEDQTGSKLTTAPGKQEECGRQDPPYPPTQESPTPGGSKSSGGSLLPKLQTRSASAPKHKRLHHRQGHGTCGLKSHAISCSFLPKPLLCPLWRNSCSWPSPPPPTPTPTPASRTRMILSPPQKKQL